MLELLKSSERTIKVGNFLKVMRDAGNETREVEEFCKWKESSNGVTFQMSVTVFEITIDSRKFGGDVVKAYCMKDSLGMMMQKSLTVDLEEIKNWLNEKGYKTVKRFYTEDYGMSEETWEEWNK